MAPFPLRFRIKPDRHADTEGCPFISKSGLDLFFRQWALLPGTSTWSYDIYVSHRESPDAPWQPEVSLGPNINSAKGELCSFLTIDGHWLYFVSARTGALGGTDIWVAHRKDAGEDAGWEAPVNLGPFVNTSAQETGPSLYEDEATGEMVLYFTGGVSGKSKIYSCRMLNPQTPAEQAAAVAELNSGSEHHDLHSFVRRSDGLEVILASDRESSTHGLYDLFVSTRASTSDPWSPPAKLGPEINSARSEARPSISWDGTTLFFWTDREFVSPYYYMHVYQATRTRLQGR